ncbi:uncharacterized protein LOC125676308 isoform X1 [Ostrea edulis]|uniref:uncharacterized protein LOC125676308 isoform X1 n=1 Tax=Ostrea edulis TaxID=37623 RepID=UPI0024AF80D1|nr:uncharacterized protein LOC125676308 isoform X1 [Ostrea edulis]
MDDDSYHPSESESDEDEDEDSSIESDHSTNMTRTVFPQHEHVSDSDDEDDEYSSVSQVFPILNGTEKKITFMKTDKSAKGHYTNKRHACLFCEKVMPNMARHLTLKHHNEPEVAKILVLSKRSKQRRQLWEELVNKGNFNHNYSVIEKGKGAVIPKYQKSNTSSADIKDYVPCYYCKGLYKRTELWKHTTSCGEKSKECKLDKQNHVKLGRLLLPPSCNNEQFEQKVLNVMRDDEVKSVVISDKRILDFGGRMFRKHGNEEHRNMYISQKLRELGRLLQLSRKRSLNALDDLLKTEHWDTLIECVHLVCGYSEVSKVYNAPSLALKLGHSLVKCASYLKSEGLKESNEEKIKTADAFLTLYENEWTESVSSHAHSTLNEKKYNKQLFIPLVEDVKKLNDFLVQRAHELCSEVEFRKVDLYPELAQVCLAQVILFNRRRSGEAERMTVAAYCDALKGSGKPDPVIMSTLNEFEKILCKSHIRVEIKGKRGRKVPVLFTADMKKSIDILLKTRQEACVTQPYLFARPGMTTKPYRGTDCMRKFCNLAELRNPSAINSTKLRKQLATLAQVLNLSETSQDILATFQGHNIKVHREFYRLPESTLQVAKVSKILHSINNGTIDRYKGMDFDQIDFADKETLDSETESEVDDDSDDDSNHESLLEEPCNSGDMGKERNARMPQTSAQEGMQMQRPSSSRKLGGRKQEGMQMQRPSSSRKLGGRKQGSVQRHTWTSAEKAALHRQFDTFIKVGKTPGQVDCLNGIRMEKSLSTFTWRHVKFAVKNIITSRQRCCKK